MQSYMMKRVCFLGVVAASGLMLASCGGPIEVGQSPDLQLVDAKVLPPGDNAPPSALVAKHYIGPHDKLRIDVYGMENMDDRLVVVDAAGNLSFPLAGQVSASGLTTAEVADRLRARLREKHVRDPQVSVNLEEAAGNNVTVEGAVVQGGIFPVRERMTLLKAIAAARGTTADARSDAVLIFRTVAGTRYVAAYNLKAIRRGNYADPEVYANDIVVVNASEATRLFRDIAPLLTAPLIAVLNQVSL